MVPSNLPNHKLQLQETKMSSQQNKNIACSENQEVVTASEFSSFYSEQAQGFKQLKLILFLPCWNLRTTNYALIGHGSQFSFIVHGIADKQPLLSIKHSSMSLRYINIDHEKPVAKVDNPIHISLQDKPDNEFSMSDLYKTIVWTYRLQASSTWTRFAVLLTQLGIFNFHASIMKRLELCLVLTHPCSHYLYRLLKEIIYNSSCTYKRWTNTSRWIPTEQKRTTTTLTQNKTSTFCFPCYLQQNKRPLDYLVQEYWKLEEKGITAPNKNYSSDDKSRITQQDLWLDDTK